MAKTLISFSNLALFKKKADDFYVIKSMKNRANGFVGLDENSKIDIAFIPDALKQAHVLEYDTKELLPKTGDPMFLYKINKTNDIYYFDNRTNTYRIFVIAHPNLTSSFTIDGVVSSPKTSFNGYEDVTLETMVTEKFPTADDSDIDSLFKRI